MTDEERYLFDLQGYLIIEQALSIEHLADLNATINHYSNRGNPPEKPWFRQDNLLSWGQCFRNLIDPPAIAPYLQALLGQGYRLDHDYLHIIHHSGPGPIGSHLHGGATPYDPGQYYHFQNGNFYNGLTAVAYHLTNVHPGDGGFGCIPGSHKSNLPLPKGWGDLTNPPACVQEVAGPAGMAIIFTEALTHGTLPWNGSGDRRTLFFKYSPRPSAWSRHGYNTADFPDLTAAQIQRLKTPGIYPD